LEVSGAAGGEYGLVAWNAGLIEKVEGAEFNPIAGKETIGVRIPRSDSEEYPRVKIVIHFSTGQKKGKPEKH
jgi:hypothetical protein